MVSGKEVHKEIKSNISGLRKEEANLSRVISQYKDDLDGFRNGMAETYKELARVYLPELDACAVENTLESVRADMKSFFDAKQKRRAHLETSLKDNGVNRVKLEERLSDFTDSLNEKALQRDKAEAEINSELSANDDYQAIKKQADYVKQRVEKNSKRSETFSTEADSKLSGFESSRLFMYLVRQNYGEDNQRGGKIVRYLDSWIAGRINFAENKKNYDFLKSMPVKMQEEVKRQQEEMDELVSKMEKIEGETARKYSLPTILNEGDILEKTRQEIVGNLERADNERKAYAQEMSLLDNSRGEYYEEAIDSFADFLDNEDIKSLRKRALKTPDSRDDGLVDKIEDFVMRISNKEKEIEEVIRRRSIITSKLNGLEDIERTFVKNDYDSSRSVFGSGFNPSDFLTGYLMGKYSANEIKTKIGENHRFKPAETYHSSASYSSSSHSRGGFSSGRSFGGGGFSSGRSFGGGGFSSGRSF